MLRIHTYCLLFVTILTIPQIVYCKSHSADIDYHFGIVFSVGRAYHFTSTNRILNNPSCCVEDLHGSGSYYSYGIALNSVISDIFVIQFTTEMQHYRVDFNSTETTIINFEGKPENAVINYIAKTQLFLISPKIAINVSLCNDFYTSLGIGTLFDIDSRTEQFELLVEPYDRGTFPDTGTRRRNHFQGQLENFSGFIPYIEVSFGKHLQLDNHTRNYLDLSGNLTYSFLELIKDSNWKILNLNFKAAFYFRL